MPGSTPPDVGHELAPRQILRLILSLVLFALSLWVLLDIRPPGIALKALLAGIASLSVGIIVSTVTDVTRKRLAPAAVAAVATMGLIGTYLTITSGQSESTGGLPTAGSSSATTEATTGSGTERPSGPPTNSDKAPLSASLEFGNRDSKGDECEAFIVRADTQLPPYDQFNAEWVYGTGGASTVTNEIAMYIESQSQQSVIIKGIDMVNVERKTPPSESVEVLKCGGTGGEIPTRYLEVNFDEDAPRLVPRPATVPAGASGDPEPAVRYPLKVSQTDPEFFILYGSVVKQPECLCTWQIAVRWSRGAENGTLLIDRGFSKLRTDTRRELPAYLYQQDGTLEQIR